MPKFRRVRDPVHDLIEFDDSDFECALWAVIDSREFQRLRRIKQLGFSELTFPGASHTRFAHSVGVFNTARELDKQIIRLGKHDERRAQVALCAALVHDIGHGPFSHTFEGVMARLGAKKSHEDWTADIIRGDTELGAELEKLGPDFREDVAALLSSETPSDIYASLVSSQLDADRLDYVRRDRLMAGVEHANFDYSWLLANLEVETVPYSIDKVEWKEAETLILGKKALEAAEEFVLGLFHLYFSVYYHKATRSAEKMLSSLLHRIGEVCRDGDVKKLGVGANNPIVRFLEDMTLENYLALDDSVVWGSLPILCEAGDPMVSELANRILRRKLFKAVNVSEQLLPNGGEAALATFKSKLAARKKEEDFPISDVLEDSAPRTPYKKLGYETPGARSKILIRRSDGDGFEDLADSSKVVDALKPRTVYRVYVRNDEARELVEGIMKEVKK